MKLLVDVLPGLNEPLRTRRDSLNDAILDRVGYGGLDRRSLILAEVEHPGTLRSAGPGCVHPEALVPHPDRDSDCAACRSAKLLRNPVERVADAIPSRTGRALERLAVAAGRSDPDPIGADAECSGSAFRFLEQAAQRAADDAPGDAAQRPGEGAELLEQFRRELLEGGLAERSTDASAGATSALAEYEARANLTVERPLDIGAHRLADLGRLFVADANRLRELLGDQGEQVAGIVEVVDLLGCDDDVLAYGFGCAGPLRAGRVVRCLGEFVERAGRVEPGGGERAVSLGYRVFRAGEGVAEDLVDQAFGRCGVELVQHSIEEPADCADAIGSKAGHGLHKVRSGVGYESKLPLLLGAGALGFAGELALYAQVGDALGILRFRDAQLGERRVDPLSIFGADLDRQIVLVCQHVGFGFAALDP